MIKYNIQYHLDPGFVKLFHQLPKFIGNAYWIIAIRIACMWRKKGDLAVSPIISQTILCILSSLEREKGIPLPLNCCSSMLI